MDLYQVEVVETFGGTAGSTLTVFTRRDSGGFYMDRAQKHDVGGEYLLFLNPGDPASLPNQARGAMTVNYNCGQSRPWREVSAADRRTLAQLRGR